MQKISHCCCCCALLAVALLICIDAGNYEILADEERLFEQCVGEDAYGEDINDQFEVVNLEKIYDDNSRLVYINAEILVKVDMPADVPIMMKIELQRWARGRWMKTPFSMKRADMCKALRNPNEFWHSFTKDIPVMMTDCPPKMGTIYKMENMSSRLVLHNLPSLNVQGKYKAILHFKRPHLETCMLGYFDIY